MCVSNFWVSVEIPRKKCTTGNEEVEGKRKSKVLQMLGDK